MKPWRAVGVPRRQHPRDVDQFDLFVQHTANVRRKLKRRAVAFAVFAFLLGVAIGRASL